jgi:hypothetical protein
MLVLDREHVRQAGAADAARQAVSFLTRPGGPPDGFGTHLDADVFDETIMRSVDDPRPDGLTWNKGIASCARPWPRTRWPDCRWRSTTPTSTPTGLTASAWHRPSEARMPASLRLPCAADREVVPGHNGLPEYDARCRPRNIRCRIGDPCGAAHENRFAFCKRRCAEFGGLRQSPDEDPGGLGCGQAILRGLLVLRDVTHVVSVSRAGKAMRTTLSPPLSFGHLGMLVCCQLSPAVPSTSACAATAELPGGLSEAM